MGSSADRRVVKFAPLNEQGELDVPAFDELVGPRTRVIAMTGLSNVLGTVLPLEHISKRAREVGACLSSMELRAFRIYRWTLSASKSIFWRSRDTNSTALRVSGSAMDAVPYWNPWIHFCAVGT